MPDKCDALHNTFRIDFLYPPNRGDLTVPAKAGSTRRETDMIIKYSLGDLYYGKVY